MWHCEYISGQIRTRRIKFFRINCESWIFGNKKYFLQQLAVKINKFIMNEMNCIQILYKMQSNNLQTDILDVTLKTLPSIPSYIQNYQQEKYLNVLQYRKIANLQLIQQGIGSYLASLTGLRIGIISIAYIDVME